MAILSNTLNTTLVNESPIAVSGTVSSNATLLGAGYILPNTFVASGQITIDADNGALSTHYGVTGLTVPSPLKERYSLTVRNGFTLGSIDCYVYHAELGIPYDNVYSRLTSFTVATSGDSFDPSGTGHTAVTKLIDGAYLGSGLALTFVNAASGLFDETIDYIVREI